MIAHPIVVSLVDWVLKRGILYGLTQLPMLALVAGYFTRLTTFSIANVFVVVLAFTLLPAWILFRRGRSTDPDEPVHHLATYAVWALVPYVVYNLARVPMHYLLDVVFWDHWYDYGYEFTGEPVDQWSSLIPGTAIHSLQGYVLALGFYILFKKHSLINALAYVWIFLSAVYTWTFPTFVLVDFQPPLKWFFVVWWAHFWMALAAWYLPKRLYSTDLWERLRGPWTRIAAIVAIVVIYTFPVTFVFWRVAVWQFDYQDEIDASTFRNVRLVLQESATVTAIDDASAGTGPADARYAFTLRFGPRPYTDYINATKAVDAGPVEVTGRLLSDGEVIAYCWSYVAMLETPNTILDPAAYFPALQRMEYTDIDVECIGPAEIAEDLEANGGVDDLDVDWSADVTLIGDRNQEEHTFGSAEE